MRIYLPDQERILPKHLERIKTIPVLPYQIDRLKHKVSSILVPSPAGSHSLRYDSFFNYDIFPVSILQALTQWKSEGREMRVNDNIVQQAFLPPFGSLSVKIVMGVRIKEIFDTDERKGFSYETLQGHIERGISYFIIQRSNSQFTFTIETFSEPAIPLFRVFNPISSLYQDYCTGKALKHTTDHLAKGSAANF